MTPQRQLTLLALGACVAAWGALGCGGAFGFGDWHSEPSEPTTIITYKERCDTYLLDTRYDDPGGTESPPGFPTSAGAPLDKGQHRLGLEVNPFLIRGSGGDRVEATNWTMPTQIGGLWRGGILDELELGAYFRHSVQEPAMAMHASVDHSPPHSTNVFNAGLMFRGNWRLWKGRLVLSAMAELGVRSRKGYYRQTDSYRKTCTMTCYAERGSMQDQEQDEPEVYEFTDSGYLQVNRAVIDPSIGLQAAARLAPVLWGIAGVALQMRGLNESSSDDDQPIFSDELRKFLRWSTFPVVNPGLGLDLAVGHVFAKAFVFYPVALGEKMDYGVGLSFATGAQF